LPNPPLMFPIVFVKIVNVKEKVDNVLC